MYVCMYVVACLFFAVGPSNRFRASITEASEAPIVLIQIAIGQVLQLFQSDSQVFAVPSPLSKKCALQHAFRIVALPCNGALRSHLWRWLRVFACASP